VYVTAAIDGNTDFETVIKSNDRTIYASIAPKRSAGRQELYFKRPAAFNVPRALRPRVNFWKKIYSIYSTRQAVIHDKINPNKIYEIVNLNRYRPGSRSERNFLRKKRLRITGILKTLYRNKGRPKTKTEKRIAAIWPEYKKNYKKFYKAAKNVRSQRGQADRFKNGIKRSGRYLAQMKRIFKSYGLPQELTALPHVESSFNYRAYSSAGAAGIWQFTRHTGKLFMKINYAVDERRDPILATHAAAKLLRQNYKALQSWPLAITAYNHGLGGMKRAKRKHGKNITRIINRYKSRIFGFASKNFYSEFIAALEVAGSYKTHFGSLTIFPPRTYSNVRLTHYISARDLSRLLNIPHNTLKRYNPALRRSVWKGHRRIPKGYKVRLPYRKGNFYVSRLRSIPSSKKFISQKHNGYHVVTRGDTLSTIAINYRTTVNAIKDMNNLRSTLIRTGKKLRIPTRLPRYVELSRSATNKAMGVFEGDKYIVGRGDTLSAIAKASGMTTKELAKLNGIKLSSVIYTKQKLKVKKDPLKSRPKPKQPSSNKNLTLPTTLEVNNLAKDIGVEYLPINGGKLKLNVEDYTFEKVDGLIGSLRVKTDETLGHYAEWALVPTRKLRVMNKRRIYRSMHVGSLVRIPLSKVGSAEFERKRLEYHMQLFEDFFDAFTVRAEKKVTIKKGQSLWHLCVTKNDAPIWLVRMYNSNVVLDRLKPGDVIKMPIVVKR